MAAAPAPATELNVGKNGDGFWLFMATASNGPSTRGLLTGALCAVPGKLARAEEGPLHSWLPALLSALLCLGKRAGRGSAWGTHEPVKVCVSNV
jgi:hypothetical protein